MLDLVLAFHYGSFDTTLLSTTYELLFDGRQYGKSRFPESFPENCR